MSEETKRLNILVTAELHRELKVEAARQGITIGAFVADAIKEKIQSERSK